MAFCHNCGVQVKRSDAHCGNCGEKQGEEHDKHIPSNRKSGAPHFSSTSHISDEVTRLQKRNVLLMILLTIITYGIYVPVWFLNRKDAFNNLNSKEKISNGPIIFVLVIFIISAIMLIPLVLFMETEIGTMIDVIDSMISLVGGITILVMSFKVRRIMNEHYKTNISGVATFFFSFLYLQYKINHF